MDEPSAGLAPIITHQVFETIRRLNREIGLTVLMIEQNPHQGLEASHRGYALEMGRNTYQGPAKDLIANPQVRRAFFRKGALELFICQMAASAARKSLVRRHHQVVDSSE